MERLENVLNKKRFICTCLFFCIYSQKLLVRGKVVFIKFPVKLSQEISGALALAMLF
jgi:hypothetical protein